MNLKNIGNLDDIFLFKNIFTGLDEKNIIFSSKITIFQILFILSRPPLVPPFIILAHIFNLFSYMFKLWCKPKNKSNKGIEFQNAMVSSIHAASRPVSPTHDIRGITVEIEQIKERRRSGKRPFRTYHKSARSFNFPGIGRLLLI